MSKINIIGYFCLFVTSIIVLITPGATGYEFSIYDQYPWFFWASIIISLSTGSIIIIREAFQSSESNNWKWGFFLILISDFLLLSLPLFRGYLTLGSGDTLTHIGHIKDIIGSGHIGSLNIYPLDHILATQISLLTGINPYTVTLIIPIIFSYLFIISFLLLSRHMFKNQRREWLISITISSLLIFGYYSQLLYAPNPQAFLYMPFVIYVFLRSRVTNSHLGYSIILIPIFSFTVFFHPLIALSLLTIILVWTVLKHIGKKHNIFLNSADKDSRNIISIGFVIFFIWQGYLITFKNGVVIAINALTGQGELSEFQSYSNALASSDLGVLGIVKLSVTMYGQQLILGFLAIIAICIIFRKMRHHNQISEYYVYSCILFILFLVGGFMVSQAYKYGIARLTDIAFIFSIFLAAIAIPLIFKKYTNEKVTNGLKRYWRTLSIVAAIGIIVCMIFASTFNLYPSPIIKRQNQQCSYSEHYGMQYFFMVENEKIQIIDLGIVYYRYYHAIYGVDAFNNRDSKTGYTEIGIPDHFGYTNSTSISNEYDGEMYLIINNIGKYLYPVIYPEYAEKWRYSENDFFHLKIDSNVNGIYSNGNLDIYDII